MKNTEITDAPRFRHRGVLLDASRHFLAKETIFSALVYIYTQLFCCCINLLKLECSRRAESYQIRQIASCAGAGNAGNAFPRRRLKRKLVISDPCMHHGTCVTHVPWCMSGSLTHDGGENVPGIPGASAILRIWQDAHAVAEYALDSFSNRWPAVMILTVCNVDIIVFYGKNFFNLQY